MCEFTGLDFEMAIFEHYFEVDGGGLTHDNCTAICLSHPLAACILPI